MKPELEKINQFFAEIQDDFFPVVAPLRPLTGEEKARWWERIKQHKDEYEHSIHQLRVLLEDSPIDEVIVVYRSGCRLFRQGVTGYIIRHFDVAYLPLAREAVRENHPATVFYFLQLLVRHAPDEAVPFVMTAFDNPDPQVRQAAISLAYEHRLRVAISKIQQLTTDKDADTASLARSILESMTQTQ